MAGERLKNRRAKISARINALAGEDKPLRELAGSLSKMAKYAMDEANSLSLENIEIPFRRLPDALDGFKIVQLTDTHHSPFTNLDHIKRAIKIANRLKPDIFFLTGDYVSHEPEYISPVAEALAELKAEYGIYACMGNHDHWTDGDLVVEEFRKKNIPMLVNDGIRLKLRGEDVWICGVDDYMVGKTDLPAALDGSTEDEFKILLAHNPIIFRQAVRAGVDLTLSGHTHGGQVRLRETSRRLLRRRKLSSGLHSRRDSQIYISRGIGTVVLPIRYQCPPEISLLTLRSAK